MHAVLMWVVGLTAAFLLALVVVSLVLAAIDTIRGRPPKLRWLAGDLFNGFRFSQWAMPVSHRGWAAASVVLHRFQRMTVLSRRAWVGHSPITPGDTIRHLPGHNAINRAEWWTFDRATRSRVRLA